MKRLLLIAGVCTIVVAAAPALAQSAKSDGPVPARVAAEPAVRPRVVIARPARPRLATVVRYGGSGGWSLADADMIQDFFESRFGRPLPVSAWGQTALHDRLRLDHRNAFDVAVHPDSTEGRELMEYLRNSGIPFVAVRKRMPGSSTGAHIHVGPESERLPRSRQPAAVAKVKTERKILARKSPARPRPEIMPDDQVLAGSLAIENVADRSAGTPPI
jgi:hypothetical protein